MYVQLCVGNEARICMDGMDGTTHDGLCTTEIVEEIHVLAQVHPHSNYVHAFTA